jgi:hypothetical protein
MRIEDSLPPTLLGIEPGDEMELEVVSTEGAVESDRGCRYGRGYKDEGRSRKSVPAGDPLQFEWETIRPCY